MIINDKEAIVDTIGLRVVTCDTLVTTFTMNLYYNDGRIIHVCYQDKGSRDAMFNKIVEALNKQQEEAPVNKKDIDEIREENRHTERMAEYNCKKDIEKNRHAERMAEYNCKKGESDGK